MTARRSTLRGESASSDETDLASPPLMLPSILSITLIGVTLAGALVWESRFAALLDRASTAADAHLRWWYVLLVAFLTAFVFWLGLGRYKNVRLGRDDEQPEYRLLPWLAMLFAAGTGVGLLFWSVAEPIAHFQGSPFTQEALSPEAASRAVQLSFFHWGLNGWAIFATVALIFGYFGYRQGLPLAPRSALHPILGERIFGLAGHLVDTLAVVATVFGLATTLGLGARQTSTGLTWLFGMSPSSTVDLVVVLVVTAIATVSVVSGVRRGVRVLSEINLWLTVVLLIGFVTLGPTDYLVGLMVQETGGYLDNFLEMTFYVVALVLQETGGYLDNFLEMTFYVGANDPSRWQSTWTVFFWGWWIAWSPFVGLFIARISRGRTIREFVLGVLVVPSLMTFVWIAVMGGTALHSELFDGGGIVAAVQEDIAMAVFATIEHLGSPPLVEYALGLLSTILISVYFVTSADSGALVINIILAGGALEPSRSARAAWAIGNGVLTAVLLLAGGIAVLQDAVILAALPFSVILLLMIWGFLVALRREPGAAPRPGCKGRRAEEPWTGAGTCA